MASKLIILVLGLFAFQDSVKSNSIRNCLNVEDITEKDATLFFNRSNSTEITNKMKCFGACILETMNLIDGCHLKYEEAKLNLTMQEKLDMVTALDLCKDSIQGSERCEIPSF